jgi:uncharacterized caspase-like protein
VRTLTDAEATRSDILRGLKWLRDRPKQRDVAVLFLSGHGFRASGMDGHYFFLPYDGDVLDVDVTGVPGDAFRRYLRNVKARTVLLLDTCYSGALDQNKYQDDPDQDGTRRKPAPGATPPPPSCWTPCRT